MSDMASDAIDWWKSQMQSHLATSITYSRGPNTVSLTATIGTTDYEIAIDGGISVVAQTRDYLMPAEDLVLAGQTTLPRAGDHIQEAGSTDVYEVLSIGSGSHFFRYADPHRTVLRIHTKLSN